jgi:hypothetical protein
LLLLLLLQEIRTRWKVSAALGSEFSKRSRSPDPMDRSVRKRVFLRHFYI